MSAAKSKSRSVVLDFAGPPLWPSHQEIQPVLRAVWKKLGIPVIKTWFPNPVFTENELETIARAQDLILPLGSFHVDSLSTIKKLREAGFTGRLVCMCAGDGFRGQAYLRSRMDTFRSDDVLIANSPAEKKLLEWQIGKELRIEAIPLPVDIQKFSPAKNRGKLRAAFGFKSNQKCLVYAGRISAQKNVISLVTVFKELLKQDSTWQLLICGPVDDIGVPHIENENRVRYVEELMFWISEMKLKDKVQFLGQLSQEELANLFKAADAFATCTLHASEDFGYALAQAVCSGLPAVTTRWGGGSWFVDENLAKGIDVILTPKNSVKIDFQQATSLFAGNPKPAVLRTQRLLSVESVAKCWKQILSSKNKSVQKTVRFTGPRFQSGRITAGSQKNYRKLCEVYGARERSSQTYYWNPLWLPQHKHLFDPISFRRNFPEVKGASTTSELKRLVQYGLVIAK